MYVKRTSIRVGKTLVWFASPVVCDAVTTVENSALLMSSRFVSLCAYAGFLFQKHQSISQLIDKSVGHLKNLMTSLCCEHGVSPWQISPYKHWQPRTLQVQVESPTLKTIGLVGLCQCNATVSRSRNEALKNMASSAPAVQINALSEYFSYII